MKVLTQKDKKKLKSYFKNRSDVVLAILFGSHGTEFQRNDSDIDFAILFDNKISMMEEMKILDELSGILSFENIDLLNLNKASVIMKFEALSGQIIYERDFDEISDFMEKVFKTYGDITYMINEFNTDVLNRGINADEY
ncbi:type VII toxin-antitoxin system MntA family adenylyltransferase antitoxin [Desulfitibacter alkalitolerans]|uniref:type VII toxin-antitoxin system MntA family adenylyltransferase antitoxin n=1 Tax=Desulfitibacter alkalitolerans TaxID=264641 RepID=UPI000482CF30|nr:nucleotidyltransferase domain-containing protein [Desulfitibacter alkalitolerans]